MKNYDPKLKIHSFFKFKHFKLSFFTLIFTFLIIASSEANAGTIIKSPAYLGLSRGLVGCWNFDGNYTKVPDCSGNNNTGTITSGPIRTAGKIGQAISFDGITSGQTVDTSLSLTVVNTICFWMNATRIPGASVYQAPIIDVGTSYHGLLTTNNNELQVWNDADSLGSLLTTISTLDWYYICLVREGNSITNGLKLYKDGILSSQANTLAWTPSGAGLWIGNQENVPTRTFDGKIDNVHVYNRALSATEIQRLYQIGLGSKANRSQTSSFNTGLVGHWTFDGADIFGTSARDKSGNGNHGVITSATKVQGKIGQALNFDGSDDYVGTGAGDTSILDIPGAVTISAWIYSEDFSAYDAIVSNYNSAGNVVQYNLVLYPGAKPTFGVGPSIGNWKLWTAASGVADRTWTHVVATHNGNVGDSDVKIYINGVSESLTPQTSGSPSVPTINFGNIAVGRDGDFNGNYFDGQIDDVRIYNRVLSAAEANRLYMQTQSKYNTSNPDSLKHGLIGYWTFDGADISGTRAKDKSGQGNHGTITDADKSMGKIGQALSFDDDNDGEDKVITSTISPIPQSLTVSAWIYPTAGGVVLTEFGDGGGWHESQMEVMSTGEIKVGYWIGTMFTLSLGTFSLNQWHHVVLTFDNNGNLGRGYVDGLLRNSNTADKQYPSTLYYSMGAGEITNHGDGTTFDGKIDEVRIYNRALSAGEVNKLYQMGR